MVGRVRWWGGGSAGNRCPTCMNERYVAKRRTVNRLARQRADLWKGSPDSSIRRLANHFSRIAWAGGSIAVKATPIPEFGVEWTTLPEAARLVPPWVILSETFVPTGNGSVVCT